MISTYTSKSFFILWYDEIRRCQYLISTLFSFQKNRQLLKEFAQSCQQVLTRQGQVMVGLCAGQGGTDFDTKSRIEADSWQIGKMMAFGELQAVEIAALDLSELNNYTSFGYRSLDKGFHIENSILHVFEPSQFGIALVDDYDFLQDKLQALNHGDFKGRTMMNELRHKIRAENETCEELPPLAGEWADLKALIVKSSDVVSFQFFLLFCPSTCFNANPLKFLLVTNHLTLNFEVMIKDDASPCQVFDISTCFGQSNTTWRHFWTLQPNLCPLSTFHDLSFWLPSPDSKIDFSLDLVNDFYWRHAGDFVANLEVIDDSFEKRGKKSWTIRLHYLIFKTAMSLTTLWDFHYNKLGRKLAKSFGLELR